MQLDLMRNNDDDITVIDRIRSGDKEACTYLVERYQQKVFQTCIGFLHDDNEAQDLTQDVLIKVCRSLDSFKGNATFSTWLYRITVNMAINRTRTLKLRSVFRPLDTVEKSRFIAGSEGSDQQIIRREQKQLLQKVLGKLTSAQRKAFVLSQYRDLTNKEIAEVMELSIGAVESLLFRARVRLQEVLKRNSKLEL